jgi:hypothetical protein
MTLRIDQTFDRLVDQVVNDALELLPTEQQKEIVILAFGLRDGVYQSAQAIGEALDLAPVEVMLLLEQALQTVMRAQFHGQLRVGATG